MFEIGEAGGGFSSLLEPAPDSTSAAAITSSLNNVDSRCPTTMRSIRSTEPPRDRARRVVWFIEAVHERRGLPEALLRALRDRWAASLQLHLALGSLVGG